MNQIAADAMYNVSERIWLEVKCRLPVKDHRNIATFIFNNFRNLGAYTDITDEMLLELDLFLHTAEGKKFRKRHK